MFSPTRARDTTHRESWRLTPLRAPCPAPTHDTQALLEWRLHAHTHTQQSVRRRTRSTCGLLSSGVSRVGGRMAGVTCTAPRRRGRCLDPPRAGTYLQPQTAAAGSLLESALAGEASTLDSGRPPPCSVYHPFDAKDVALPTTPRARGVGLARLSRASTNNRPGRTCPTGFETHRNASRRKRDAPTAPFGKPLCLPFGLAKSRMRRSSSAVHFCSCVCFPMSFCKRERIEFFSARRVGRTQSGVRLLSLRWAGDCRSRA